MRKIIITAVLITLSVCILYLAGCDQRLAKYHQDPNEVEIVYKSNRLASEEDIDSIVIETPSGWKVYIGKYRLDNDSMKLKVNPLLHQYELETEK